MKMKHGAKGYVVVPPHGVVAFGHDMTIKIHIYANQLLVNADTDKYTARIKRMFGRSPKEVLTGADFNYLLRYVYENQRLHFIEFVTRIANDGELMLIDNSDSVLAESMASCVFIPDLARAFFKDMRYLCTVLNGKDKRYTRVYNGLTGSHYRFLLCDIADCLDAMEATILKHDFPVYAYDTVMSAYRNARLIAELSAAIPLNYPGNVW